LWRHDVDFSIHRAFALANVEKKMKIKATDYRANEEIKIIRE
jgi:hypothetical protein